MRGGVLITLDPPGVERADLLIRDGVVVRKGPRLLDPGDVEVLDARGRLVMPGLVNLHTRLGDDPFRGLTGPDSQPPGHPRRLHALVAAHSQESVIWSAFVAALEAVAAGTTMISVLHTSPAFTAGSLHRLREVLLTLGLRCTLAYRVADEDGPERLEEAVASTREAAAYGGTEQVRMAVGVGTLADLSDATLRTLGEIAARYEAPVHLEVGRTREDSERCRRKHGAGAVRRLDAVGLLGPATTVAHLVHVEEEDLELLKERGAVPVHCPTDDLLSREGRAPLPRFLERGALGSGSGGGDPLQELRTAWHLAQGFGETATPDAMLQLLAGGHRQASRLFGQTFGHMQEGDTADLVILDYQPPIPLTPATLPHHLLCGISSRHVQSVLVGGRFVLRDRACPDLDLPALMRLTRRGSVDLWSAWTGTPFPGLAPGYEEDEEDTGAEAETREPAREEEPAGTAAPGSGRVQEDVEATADPGDREMLPEDEGEGAGDAEPTPEEDEGEDLTEGHVLYDPDEEEPARRQAPGDDASADAPFGAGLS